MNEKDKKTINSVINALTDHDTIYDLPGVVNDCIDSLKSIVEDDSNKVVDTKADR